MIATFSERSGQDQVQLAEDLLARRDVKKAEVAIARALRNAATPEERAKILTLRARARLLSARPDDALDDLNTVQTLRPETAGAPDHLELTADCYLARFELATVGFADRNDTAQALALYQRIVEQYPQYENLGWVRYQMGRAYLTDNRVTDAIEAFHDALFAPSHVAALTAYCFERLAFVHFYETRDLFRALAFINKAVDTYPMQEDRRWLVQVHILRSRILRDAGRHDQGLKAAEDALLAASANGGENKLSLAEAHLTTGELLHEMENRERDVIAHLQQFLQLSRKPLGVDVTWSRVYEMLGDAYFKAAQYSAAASAYQNALQFNPYHPWELSLLYRIGRCYYQNGDYERSIQTIRQMLDVAARDGQPVSDYRVYEMLGNAYYALSRYDEATEAYEIALSLAPANGANLENLQTYYKLAQELRRNGN